MVYDDSNTILQALCSTKMEEEDDEFQTVTFGLNENEIYTSGLSCVMRYIINDDNKLDLKEVVQPYLG